MQAIFALEGVRGFGPIKFRILHDAKIEPRSLIESPGLLPVEGRTGEKLRAAIQSITSDNLAKAENRAVLQINQARELSASILTYCDAEYPGNVYRSNNPIPVLYVLGDPTVWKADLAIAVVGSRNIREPYASNTRSFAKTAASNGVVVLSGFALGTDSIGHRAAFEVGGRTVCVMPCGLDQVFPPENQALWRELKDYRGATFVSEFGFGQRASSLHLRKRNKLIVAFSNSVLVAQSTIDGGAMNAYRAAREQRKLVATFKSDGSEDTSGNTLIEGDDRTGKIAFEFAADGSESESWLRQML